ncbi:MAG TPA: thioredoxin family protein [Acidimicrobiales bacterium]
MPAPVLPVEAVRQLSLDGVGDDDVAAVARCTGLRFLALAGDLTDDGAARAVEGLDELVVLDLVSDRIEGPALARLPAGLVHLTVRSARLDPAALRPLAELRWLGSLALGGRPLDDALVDALLALRPAVESLAFELPDPPPDTRRLERLLRAGFEVEGHGGAGGTAPDVARRVARLLTPTPPAPPPGGAGDVRPLVTEAQLDALVAAGGEVLVELTAAWCGPCRALEPAVADVARALADRTTVVAVDVDVSPWAKRRFGRQGVPTFVLFRDGREVARLGGLGGAPSPASLLDLVRGAPDPAAVPRLRLAHGEQRCGTLRGSGRESGTPR